MPTDEAKLPLGLIVEGDGEFHSFPSLIARIKNEHPGYLPIVNANGYGNITCRAQLQNRLNNLLRVNCINKIIICLDALDPIRDKIVQSCIELKDLVQGHINDWLIQAEQNTKILHIPNIVIVIQVQKLETWMLADTNSLTAKQIINLTQELTDVDSIPNPITKLRQIETQYIDSKNPLVVKKIMSGLSVDRMRVNSKSFNKFSREVI